MDPELITEENFQIAIQFNGKVKCIIDVDIDADEDEVVQETLTNERVVRKLSGEEIKKYYYVKGKVLNIVTTCALSCYIYDILCLVYRIMYFKLIITEN